MLDQVLTEFLSKISDIHEELGIPSDYAEKRGLPLEPECQDLVDAGFDIFSRHVLMERRTYAAWRNMHNKALSAGIELQLVSAFRSADYQKILFENKLNKGQSLGRILQVNAAPGYSEHHSGQALDLGCSGYPCLGEEFEQSPAFSWLLENGPAFGFNLSFPRENAAGFAYEPWHWRFSDMPRSQPSAFDSTSRKSSI